MKSKIKGYSDLFSMSTSERKLEMSAEVNVFGHAMAILCLSVRLNGAHDRNMVNNSQQQLFMQCVFVCMYVCVLCVCVGVCYQGDELQLVREALRSLRDSFSGHDPQHHTLDTLEQGVASLMDRLHTLDPQRRQDREVLLVHTHLNHHMIIIQ